MAEVEKRQHSRGKYWLTGIVAGGILAYMAVQYFGPYARMARELKAGEGVKKLQVWAVEELDHPPAGTVGTGEVAAKEWPVVVKGLPVLKVWYVKGDSTSVQEHLRVMCGNRFYRYGLEVGRAGYRPADRAGFAFEEVGEGVWGYWPTSTSVGE